MTNKISSIKYLLACIMVMLKGLQGNNSERSFLGKKKINFIAWPSFVFTVNSAETEFVEGLKQ